MSTFNEIARTITKPPGIPRPPGPNQGWVERTSYALRNFCLGWTGQNYNTLNLLLAGLVNALDEDLRFKMMDFILEELIKQTKIAAEFGKAEAKTTSRPYLYGKTTNVNDLLNSIIERADDNALAKIFIKTFKKDLKVVGFKLPPTKIEIYKAKIRRAIKEYRAKIDLGKLKIPGDFLKEVGRYAQGIGFFTAWNHLAREGSIGDISIPIKYTFPAMLYALPIPHVQELEVARSGMVIKFRATGSVFLANQEGGEDAVRIHCLILGDEMYMLMLLWGLFLYGRGRTKEIESMTRLKDIGALRAKMTNITSYNKDLQKPTYEYHTTFPLITRHIIIPNVYIETFSFEDKVVDGKDVLRCTVLLRTYRKPPDFAKYVIGETTHITIKNEKKLMMYQAIEYSANTAWRLFNSGGYIFNEREWKTGTDPVEHDDVYYNIGEEKIVHNAVLGLFGLM